MSVFSIGALVGALLSGVLSDLAGRKATVIVGASLYALGGTLQTSSFSLWSVYIGIATCTCKLHSCICGQYSPLCGHAGLAL